MSTRYDLEIIIGYRLKKEYSKLLKSHEWVRGIRVDLNMEVTNNSKKAFPGTKVNSAIKEYGGAMGTGLLSWGPVEQILIPEMAAGESVTLPLMYFYPLVEGLCELSLDLLAPDNSEVWVTGWRQGKPQQKTISVYYTVVGWQELEIIKLLSKLQKGG